MHTYTFLHNQHRLPSISSNRCDVSKNGGIYLAKGKLFLKLGLHIVLTEVLDLKLLYNRIFTIVSLFDGPHVKVSM